jgi:hypothetical protein
MQDSFFERIVAQEVQEIQIRSRLESVWLRQARPARIVVIKTIHADYKVVLGCSVSVVNTYLFVYERAC